MCVNGPRDTTHSLSDVSSEKWESGELPCERSSAKLSDCAELIPVREFAARISQKLTEERQRTKRREATALY